MERTTLCIRIKALVELLSAADGGRGGFIGPIYRPNHNFGDPAGRNFDAGQLEIGENLYPGESRVVEIQFLCRPGLDAVLTPGKKWRIQEALKLVGYGTVLDVLKGE